MSLQEEIKKCLIEQLSLEDLTPEDIKDDQPLFGEEGIGLDSIDALEIIVILDNHFGVVLENPESGKEVFKSVNTLVDYIVKNRS
ncbi:phosphopantetheine-binding protein [Algoriphagus sp. D3-2-R+10]|uniref:phosphopantetheine-binding protein n=1 Tax=Algoriphagus aurantiacus TaxID=3103948 RepID=UPI002B379970|nr:phosphopantetheine-binding protein [Algoriphagus sp. D3-2-R+10]MEB2777808.1 phosphopantetheine-binding protein [Algoriphagus sp. D3-2-R+10]